MDTAVERTCYVMHVANDKSSAYYLLNSKHDQDMIMCETTKSPNEQASKRLFVVEYFREQF